MTSKWVFRRLITSHQHAPFNLLSQLKPQIYQSPSKIILNHVQISQLLSVSAKEGNPHLGSSLHASFIKTHIDITVFWNSLLSLQVKSGQLGHAVKLFDEMPVRDTVSWNTMVSGFLRNGDFDRGLGLFKRLLESGFCWLNEASFTTVISGCDRSQLGFVNSMIHGLVFLGGYEREISVGNALMTAYFKCRCPDSGRHVFDEMSERNVITWTGIVSGLVQNQLYENGLRMLVEMCCGSVSPNSLTYLSSLMACSGLQALTEGRQIHGVLWKVGVQNDLCIESALMDMYSKCGSVEDAWRIFESAEELNEVSTTVILVGFAQNGFVEEAVQIFVKMVKVGIEIDSTLASAVLRVFNVETSLGLGKQIHSLIIKRSFTSNPFVNNGLINMYSKCGDLEESIKVFSLMPSKNAVSWNSMIAAFARHGDASRALQFYEEMRLAGITPTDITFLSLLNACSHAGLVETGMEFLNSMTEVHRIPPRSEHYACIVDMLGRAGLLNEAKTFIESLPVKPDILIWQALLGASCIHGDSKMGKFAADQLILASPDSPFPYITMANIYSSKGRYKERARTIKAMKEIGIDKETGVSWIEIEKKIHSFVVDDRMHPQAESIYGVLVQLFGLMVDEGYLPINQTLMYRKSHLSNRL